MIQIHQLRKLNKSLSVNQNSLTKLEKLIETDHQPELEKVSNEYKDMKLAKLEDHLKELIKSINKLDENLGYLESLRNHYEEYKARRYPPQIIKN